MNCDKNMGNDLLIIPCDLPKGHDGPCERNTWPVNSGTAGRPERATPQKFFIDAEFIEAGPYLPITLLSIAWNHGVYVRERWYGRECGNGASLSRNKPGEPEPSREKEKP